MKYRVEGKTWQVRGVDGILREESKPDVECHTAAGLLRWALDNRILSHGVGGLPYPTRFDDKWLGREGDRYADYDKIDGFCRYTITSELLSAMRRAQARYSEILHYLRKVEPEWTEGEEIHYADNSVERHDTNKYGQTRRVMLKGPSGDACF